MASEVDICNRALQKLGAKRIVSLSEDSTNARACNAAYDLLRDFELELHPWLFAIQRATLAADSEEPEWGRANAFQLPSDCLRILPPYPEDNLNDLDWQIEGRKLLTDETAPLYLRYIARIEDPNAMAPSFREALACRIALELAEQLTQSNTKKEGLREDYKATILAARKNNAIQSIPAKSPDDPWITGRS